MTMEIKKQRSVGRPPRGAASPTRLIREVILAFPDLRDRDVAAVAQERLPASERLAGISGALVAQARRGLGKSLAKEAELLGLSLPSLVHFLEMGAAWPCRDLANALRG